MSDPFITSGALAFGGGWQRIFDRRKGSAWGCTAVVVITLRQLASSVAAAISLKTA